RRICADAGQRRPRGRGAGARKGRRRAQAEAQRRAPQAAKGVPGVRVLPALTHVVRRRAPVQPVRKAQHRAPVPRQGVRWRRGRRARRGQRWRQRQHERRVGSGGGCSRHGQPAPRQRRSRRCSDGRERHGRHRPCADGGVAAVYGRGRQRAPRPGADRADIWPGDGAVDDCGRSWAAGADGVPGRPERGAAAR
ncbi:hypothetical protein IWQ57_006679, partial [Coemansia nantahalensis]